MTKEDINTFSITFKTTNEIKDYMMDWVNNYPNDIKIIRKPEDIKLISDRLIRDTDEMYKQDDVFKKIIKNISKASKIRDDYAMKHNHKYLDNGN